MRVELTLGVQEVAHGDDVAAVSVDGRLPEHLLRLSLRSDAHILLAEVFHMAVDAGTGELLRQGHLLQGQLVDSCARAAKQRRSEDGSLHDCDGGWERVEHYRCRRDRDRARGTG